MYYCTVLVVQYTCTYEILKYENLDEKYPVSLKWRQIQNNPAQVVSVVNAGCGSSVIMLLFIQQFEVYMYTL